MDESFTLPLDVNSNYDSSSSDEEYTPLFTAENAEEVYKDWGNEQPKEQVKTMAVMMMDNFIKGFGLTVAAAATETGLLLGPNEKTIRGWRKDFYRNHREFTESRQGKHSRPFVLDDEDCRRKASQWVRCNASGITPPFLQAVLIKSRKGQL